MDDTGVLGLLEELSILLEDSKPVFGKNNLRQVEIATALEIIDEIRDIFPSEFSQARQIVRERQALLDDAEAEANPMHIFLLLSLPFNYLPLLMNFPSASVKLPKHITMKSMSVHIPQPPAVSSMMIPVPVLPT